MSDKSSDGSSSSNIMSQNGLDHADEEATVSELLLKTVSRQHNLELSAKKLKTNILRLKDTIVSERNAWEHLDSILQRELRWEKNNSRQALEFEERMDKVIIRSCLEKMVAVTLGLGETARIDWEVRRRMCRNSTAIDSIRNRTGVVTKDGDTRMTETVVLEVFNG